MYNVIFKRRSVRFFKSNPISKVDMREILRAGMWAPSAKNCQPWKFVVVRGKSKDEMLALMEKGIERSEKGEGVLAGSSDLYTNARFTLKFIPSAIYTARVLEQAPVIVFVVNTKGMDYRQSYPSDKYMMELADIQSISAAIQNMCLEATARNIGSLWTCNIFFAYDELKEWLHADGEMVAAIALGYTDKEIKAMPRKPLAEVVEYRGEYPQPKDEVQEAAEAE